MCSKRKQEKYSSFYPLCFQTKIFTAMWSSLLLKYMPHMIRSLILTPLTAIKNYPKKEQGKSTLTVRGRIYTKYYITGVSILVEMISGWKKHVVFSTILIFHP